MIKKSLIILMLLALTPLFCACQKEGIIVSTGKLGHRADAYKQYLPKNNTAQPQKSGIIYLGKDYEDNKFGPRSVKFVFEK